MSRSCASRAFKAVSCSIDKSTASEDGGSRTSDKNAFNFPSFSSCGYATADLRIERALRAGFSFVTPEIFYLDLQAELVEPYSQDFRHHEVVELAVLQFREQVEAVAVLDSASTGNGRVA